MRRRAAYLLLLLAGFLATFAWGFLSHRQRFFPYGLIRASSRVVGVKPRIQDQSAKRELVESQSVSALEALGSLPYVNATFDPNHENMGVIVFEPDRAFPGLNFYESKTGDIAYLIDMAGKVIHRWTYPLTDHWRGSATLLPNGDLLLVVEDERLVRLNKSSEVLWSYEARVHHDLWIHGDEIWVLTREARVEPEIHPERKTLVDFVTVLTSEGVRKDQFSILDLLEDSAFAYLLPCIADLEFDHPEPQKMKALDILHTNHVEVFDGRLAHRSPLFREGNLLLSSRNINAIYIVDPSSRQVAWLWGPTNVTLQHHPTLLDSGNILLFDNGREKSQILEFDPLRRKIVWRYRNDDFFSATRGSVQRLPNGNTLITESDAGYVFEVTASGDTVWRFANPSVDQGGKRTVIWRMTRFSPEELAFVADRAGTGGGR